MASAANLIEVEGGWEYCESLLLLRRKMGSPLILSPQLLVMTR
jgi:hypothetical protein